MYFPGSPILVVEGTFAESVLETVVLSILNHDCAPVASAASRIGDRRRPPGPK